MKRSWGQSFENLGMGLEACSPRRFFFFFKSEVISGTWGGGLKLSTFKNAVQFFMLYAFLFRMELI